MKKCCPGFPIAFMIVFIIGAFLYYFYSFKSIAEIDFGKDVFYQTKGEEISLFEPKATKYQLCFYSSYIPKWEETLALKQNIPLLALDIYQQGEIQKHSVFNLKVSSEILLKLIHNFNLRDLPKCFIIAQDKENSMVYRYLRDDGIYKVLNFNKLGE